MMSLRWFEVGEQVPFIQLASGPFKGRLTRLAGMVDAIAPVISVTGRRAPESAYYLVRMETCLHVVRAITAQDLTEFEVTGGLSYLEKHQLTLLSVDSKAYGPLTDLTYAQAKKKLWKRFKPLSEVLLSIEKEKLR